MRRVPSTPRPDWRRTVESQGLVYPTTTGADGVERPYWFEQAHYELDAAEVDLLEAATNRLHVMSLEAARFLASGAMGRLGLAPGALEIAKASLEAMAAGGAPSLYGRFDLRHDGTGAPKLLEYNADTPTGLLESAVAQWYWLEELYPTHDQWNSIHERLVATWQKMAPQLAQAPVWFVHHPAETSGEELMTVTYLRDTADQAGLQTGQTTLDEIGWDATDWCFVVDTDGREHYEKLRTCFALYPWEDMLAEPYGQHVDARATKNAGTIWLEPPWKALLSNKALLAALWHLYPGDELLLPAYLDSPNGMEAWVAKPLHGREGENVRIHAQGIEHSQGGGYGEEGWCYQQWAPLPDFDGNKAVLGCWVVDGHAAGLGIRESDGWVTDYFARFVPHLMTTTRPDAATQAAWIAEDL